MLLGGGKVDIAQLRANWQQGLFLLDSGISREAEPLIDRFVEQYQIPG
ncbi:MAG: hypothetical protein F6K09_28805 [Merismopedia sp. SIO2A8]|nr:hypothetical protein [Merismopedia sp. SIO2A8]